MRRPPTTDTAAPTAPTHLHTTQGPALRPLDGDRQVGRTLWANLAAGEVESAQGRAPHAAGRHAWGGGWWGTQVRLNARLDKVGVHAWTRSGCTHFWVCMPGVCEFVTGKGALAGVVEQNRCACMRECRHTSFTCLSLRVCVCVFCANVPARRACACARVAGVCKCCWSCASVAGQCLCLCACWCTWEGVTRY